jgi:hypothetical protein
MAMRMMFGGHMDKSDYHQVGLTEEFLVSFLIGAGFAEARRVALFNSLEISLLSGNLSAPTDLNILTYKPSGAPESLRASGKNANAADVFADASGRRVADLA